MKHDRQPSSDVRSAARLQTNGRRFRLIVPALMFAVGLGIAEIAVRLLFPYNNPETIRESSVQYRASLFARHTLKPNTRARPDHAWGAPSPGFLPGREYSINEHGYRGRSFAIRKAPGLLRVLVLGGSSVFDVHATEGQDWPHLVERNLHGAGHTDIEVINGGVPGHASFDSLGRFYSHLWMLNPDYVLLYHGWNDIKYWTALDNTRPLLSAFAPYDHTADPFQNYVNVFDRALAVSQVYVKLRTRFLLAKTAVGPEGRIPDDRLHSEWGDAGVRQYKLNLQLLVDAAHDIGAVPVLISEASLVSTTNTQAERRRITYSYVRLTHDALVRAVAMARQTARSVAIEKRARFLDAAQALSGRGVLFEDHVHTTTQGSEALAQLVADWFGRELASRSGRDEEGTSAGLVR
jgi:lysophospholipase L1-like esterase